MYINYNYNLYKKKLWPFGRLDIKVPMYINYNYNLYKKKTLAVWPFGRSDIKVPM
jgi:hypothetical protein